MKTGDIWYSKEDIGQAPAGDPFKITMISCSPNPEEDQISLQSMYHFDGYVTAFTAYGVDMLLSTFQKDAPVAPDKGVALGASAVGGGHK